MSFTNDEIPKEKNHYIYYIDSVLKVEKKVYLQVYLEQCKYKLKKRKPINFTDAEIDFDSDYKSDSYCYFNFFSKIFGFDT